VSGYEPKGKKSKQLAEMLINKGDSELAETKF